MIISKMTHNVLKNDIKNNVTWQNGTYKTDSQENDIKLNNALIMSFIKVTLRAILL
jgi:hypothetical protein